MLVTSAISENPEGYPGPAPGRPGPLGPWFEKACPRAVGVDTSPPRADLGTLITILLAYNYNSVLGTIKGVLNIINNPLIYIKKVISISKIRYTIFIL